MIVNDFSAMNGYEFEDFIASVLKGKGFRVVQTSYSNDEGIDLIAEYDSPLFKGKYIIQCKRWRGKVGQPEVRDLYGVVTSERANKGILITTSDFTEQAYAFANGKNIELINGEVLSSLITDSSLANNDKDDTLKASSKFNQERYDYLLRRHIDIAKSHEGYDVYHELMTFLWDYFWDDNFAVCKQMKIFDRIIDISKSTLKKIKTVKRLFAYQKECKLNIFNAYLVTGRLYDATNMLLDEGDFYLDKWYPRKRQDLTVWEKGKFSLVDSGIRYCPKLRTRHLFSAYRLIGYDSGCELMQKCEDRIMCTDRDNTWVGFSEAERKLFYESAIEEREKVLSGAYDDVFYWSSVYYGDHSNSPAVSCAGSCGTDYKKAKSFHSIKDNYYFNSDYNIRCEIDKSLREHGMI